MKTIQELLNSIKSTEWAKRYTPEVSVRERTSPSTSSKEYQDISNIYKWVMREWYIKEWTDTIQQDITNKQAESELAKRASYQWLSSWTPRELALWTWITERKPSVTWVGTPAPQLKVEERSKSLLSSVLRAPKEMAQHAWKLLGASWDFWSRTAQQALSLFSTLPSYATVAWAKALWDKSLKETSYDDIWKQQINAATDRAIDIWRPTAYFESIFTWENPQESRFLMSEADALARNANSKIDSWDWFWALWDILKLAWIWFMREFANPFWIAWNAKVYDKSFKLRNPKTLWSAKISRWGNNLIWRSAKITPEERIMKIEVKWAQPYYNEVWKRITPKQPEIYAIANRAKDWSVTVRVVNTWWEIYNPELVKAAVSEAWLPAVRWTQWAVSSLPQWATRTIPAAPAISRWAVRLWEAMKATEAMPLPEQRIKERLSEIKQVTPESTIRPQEARGESLEVKTPKISLKPKVTETKQSKSIKQEAKKYKSAIEALRSPEMIEKQKITNSMLRKNVAGKSNNLYHITPTKNIESIIKEWLVPWKKPRFEWVSSKNKLSFSANEEVAKYYWSWDDVMLRTKTSYKPKDLEIDMLAWWEWAYLTKDSIKPSDLEIKVWNKWIPLNEYKATKDELDIKFEKERASWKTPAQIFAEKSKAAQAKIKEKELKAKLVSAKERSKKISDQTVRKAEKPKPEIKEPVKRKETDIIKDIERYESSMDLYEPWTKEWQKAADNHIKVVQEFEDVTWKNYLDYSIEKNIDPISNREDYIIDWDDWLVFYKKWKRSKLHELVWTYSEKWAKYFKEMWLDVERRTPEIDKKILDVATREKQFNIQKIVEWAIRDLWLPITRARVKWAPEYYSKWILAIRSIHDIPSVSHWVAHHFFNNKLPEFSKLSEWIKKEMAMYAEKKWLGKIDEWTMYINKEVFPYFIEDMLKTPRLKLSFPEMYNMVFKKWWDLYSKQFVDFFTKMDETIVIYEAMPDVIRAESLLFSWPWKESIKSKIRKLSQRNTYIRNYNKTQQNVFDDTHWAKVIDEDIASALWTKKKKNRIYIDSVWKSWEEYVSLHRLMQEYDVMLRYAEKNLKYDPKRKWTWILDKKWNPKRISSTSIWELYESLRMKSLYWEEEWRWGLWVTEEWIRREFWSLLVSRRYVDFYNNKKKIKSNIDNAKEEIKWISDEIKAIKEVLLMKEDKNVRKKLSKLRAQRRDLKKYIESEKKWYWKMNKMLKADEMSIQERKNIVNELKSVYKDELSIHDRINKAEVKLLNEEWIVSDAEMNAYMQEWWYTTFLRVAPEDFRADIMYRKTWTDTTKIKELEWSEAAIVNPVDALPYLHMETLKNYQKQRFYNELYKRINLWLVDDLKWWKDVIETKWSYTAYVKWEWWEWKAKPFRTLDWDNILSDSIDSVFWIPYKWKAERIADVVLWKPASVFQRLQTWLNPYFALAKNIFLDIPTSMLFTRTWYIPFASQLYSLVKSLRSSSYRKRIQDDFKTYSELWGIDMSKAHIDPRRVDPQKLIRNIVKSEWLRKSIRWGNPLKIAREVSRLLPRWLKFLSWLSETFTRFFEFHRAKEMWMSTMDAFEAARMVSWSFHRRWLIAKKFTKYAPYSNAQLQLMEQHINVFSKVVKWDPEKMARLAALIWLLSAVEYLSVKRIIENVKDSKPEEYEENLNTLFEYLDKSTYKKSWFVFTPWKAFWKDIKIPINPLFSTPWLLMALREVKDVVPQYEPDYWELSREWFWSFIQWWVVPEEMSAEWLVAKLAWLNPVIAWATNLAWFKTFPSLREIENTTDKALSPSARMNQDTNRFAIWFAQSMPFEVSPKRLDALVRSTWGSLWYILWNIVWEMWMSDRELEALWITPYSARELLIDKPLSSYIIEDAKPFSWETATKMYDRLDEYWKHKKRLEQIEESKMKLFESWIPVTNDDLADLSYLVEAYEQTKASEWVLNTVAEVTRYIRDWEQAWTLDTILTKQEQNKVHSFILSFLKWDMTDKMVEEYWIIEIIKWVWDEMESDKLTIFE